MKRRNFLRRCVGAAVGAATVGLLPAKTEAKATVINRKLHSADEIRQILRQSGAVDKDVIVYDNPPSADEMKVAFQKSMFQNIKVTVDLDREELFELGQRAPYHRYINFPVEVTAEIEVKKPFNYDDIYMSPEAIEDIKNWSVDQIDDVTRKEILCDGWDTTERMRKLCSVNLVESKTSTR